MVTDITYNLVLSLINELIMQLKLTASLLDDVDPIETFLMTFAEAMEAGDRKFNILISEDGFKFTLLTTPTSDRPFAAVLEHRRTDTGGRYIMGRYVDKQYLITTYNNKLERL